MDYRKESVKNCFIWFLVAIILSLPLFSSLNFSFSTYAESEIEYSSVLDDLHKDENFNEDDYPLIETDYSFQVIQIAESINNELFIYVYQPSGENLNLMATSINISTTAGDLKFINYKLKFLNSSDVFYKYLVEDYQVEISNSRYYEITSIFRAWNIEYDDELDKTNENIIDEVSFKVGKSYTFIGTGNDQQVIVDDIETINVTSKYVGFVRYSGEVTWVNKYCDRHFIAFSTDREIDNLLEADVYYSSQSVHLKYLDNSSLNENKPFSEEYGKIEDKYSYLSIYDDKVEVSVETSGLIGNKHEFSYEWDGIQTVDEFIDSVNIEKIYSSGIFNVHVVSKMTEEGLEDLKDKQWVLSFDATDYVYKPLVTGGGGDIDFTIVSDVSILRLKFISNGDIFNLGVIDNKQTSDGNPDNEVEVDYELKDIFKWLFSILAIIAVLILIAPILPTVFSIFINLFIWLFKVLWLCLKGIFTCIWWLITAPFSIFDD